MFVSTTLWFITAMLTLLTYILSGLRLGDHWPWPLKCWRQTYPWINKIWNNTIHRAKKLSFNIHSPHICLCASFLLILTNGLKL